jgi:hypothetical protein
MLWIKTRVGLCALGNDFEIRGFKWKMARTWGLLARLGSGDHVGFLGKFRQRGPWFHLAHFRDGPDVEAEMGKALQLILDAKNSNATFCDLSQTGTTDAWNAKWNPVRWP